MKKYSITLDETTVNTYWFNVEANSEEEAREKALKQDLWAVAGSREKPAYEVVEVEEIS